MVKYQWDLSELKDNLEILRDYYQNTQNEEEKTIIMEYMSMYQNMMKLCSKKENHNNNHLLNDSIQYPNFNHLIDTQILSYKENDLQILNILLQSFLPFKEVYRPSKNLTMIPIQDDNESLMLVAKDFVKKMLPPSIQKDALDILNRPNLFQFSNSKKNDNYSGMTCMDPILKKKYIFISRVNQLLDCIPAPHELFHYLFEDYDTVLATNYNMSYTFEIEGGFANILFGDYFYQNATEDKNYFNEFYIENYHNLISQIVVCNAFLDALTNKKHFRMNKFNKTLTYFDLEPFESKEEILNYMDTPLDINMKYILGYLVGIDLYYIYQKDPEFAFYLLKNIRYIKQENNVINVLRRNHITFMDDGYSNLKKYIKKIEKNTNR